jgi:hypothetical protein
MGKPHAGLCYTPAANVAGARVHTERRGNLRLKPMRRSQKDLNASMQGLPKIAPDDGSGGFQLYSPIRGTRPPAPGFDASKPSNQYDPQKKRPSSPAQKRSMLRLLRTPTHWGANQQQNWMKKGLRSARHFSRGGDVKDVLHTHSHDHDLQPDVEVWHRNHEYADAEHAMHAEFYRKEAIELARRTEMHDIEYAHEQELMEAQHKLLAQQMEHHLRPGEGGYDEAQDLVR